MNFVNEQEMLYNIGGTSRRTGPRGTNSVEHGNNIVSSYLHGKKNAKHASKSPMRSIHTTNPNRVYKSTRSQKDYEKIWTVFCFRRESWDL